MRDCFRNVNHFKQVITVNRKSHLKNCAKIFHLKMERLVLSGYSKCEHFKVTESKKIMTTVLRTVFN